MTVTHPFPRARPPAAGCRPYGVERGIPALEDRAVEGGGSYRKPTAPCIL